MFNVGGGELLVIFLVALIVLGPDKLPDAARKMGNVMSELRRMSQGFQNEIRNAMEEEPPAPAAAVPVQPAALEAVATEKDEEPADATDATDAADATDTAETDEADAADERPKDTPDSSSGDSAA